MKSLKNYSVLFFLLNLFSLYGMEHYPNYGSFARPECGQYPSQVNLPDATEQMLNETYNPNPEYAQQLEEIKINLNLNKNKRQLDFLAKKVKYPPAWHYKALEALQSNKVTTAISWLEQAVKKDVEYPPSQLLLADLLSKQNPQRSFELLSQVAQPQSIIVYNGIQYVYRNIFAVMKYNELNQQLQIQSQPVSIQFIPINQVPNYVVPVPQSMYSTQLDKIISDDNTQEIIEKQKSNQNITIEKKKKVEEGKLNSWDEFQQLCKQKETEKAKVFLKNLEKEAEGNAQIAYSLSQLYKTDNAAVKLNKYTANSWLKKASKLGSPEASFECADIFGQDRISYLVNAYDQAAQQENSVVQQQSFEKLIGSAKKNITAFNKIFSIYANQESLSEIDAQNVITVVTMIATAKSKDFLKSNGSKLLPQLIEKCPKKQLSEWGKKLFDLHLTGLSDDLIAKCFSANSDDIEEVSMILALEVKKKHPSIKQIKKKINVIKSQKDIGKETKERFSIVIKFLESHLYSAENCLWFAEICKKGVEGVIEVDKQRALRATEKASEYGSAVASLECAQSYFDQMKFSESLNCIKKMFVQKPNENQLKTAKTILVSLVKNGKIGDESLFVLLGKVNDLKLEATQISELFERITKRNSKSFFKIADQLEKYIKGSGYSALQKVFAVKTLTYAKSGVKDVNLQKKWQSNALEYLKNEKMTSELCYLFFVYHTENKNTEKLLELFEQSIHISVNKKVVDSAIKYLQEKAQKDNEIARILKKYFTQGLGTLIQVDKERAQQMHNYLVENNDIQALLESTNNISNMDEQFFLYKKAYIQAKKEEKKKISEEVIEKIGELAKKKDLAAAYYYFTELKTTASFKPLMPIFQDLVDLQVTPEFIKKKLNVIASSGMMKQLQEHKKNIPEVVVLFAAYNVAQAAQIDKPREILEKLSLAEKNLEACAKRFDQDDNLKKMAGKVYSACGMQYNKLSRSSGAYACLKKAEECGNKEGFVYYLLGSFLNENNQDSIKKLVSIAQNNNQAVLFITNLWNRSIVDESILSKELLIELLKRVCIQEKSLSAVNFLQDFSQKIPDDFFIKNLKNDISAEGLYHQAVQEFFCNEKNNEKLVDLLKQAVKKGSSLALVLLGSTYYKQEKFVEAIPLFYKYLQNYSVDWISFDRCYAYSSAMNYLKKIAFEKNIFIAWEQLALHYIDRVKKTESPDAFDDLMNYMMDVVAALDEYMISQPDRLKIFQYFKQLFDLSDLNLINESKLLDSLAFLWYETSKEKDLQRVVGVTSIAALEKAVACLDKEEILQLNKTNKRNQVAANIYSKYALYCKKKNKENKAITYYKKAVGLDKMYALHFAQLYLDKKNKEGMENAVNILYDAMYGDNKIVAGCAAWQLYKLAKEKKMKINDKDADYYLLKASTFGHKEAQQVLDNQTCRKAISLMDSNWIDALKLFNSCNSTNMHAHICKALLYADEQKENNLEKALESLLYIVTQIDSGTLFEDDFDFINKMELSKKIKKMTIRVINKANEELSNKSLKYLAQEALFMYCHLLISLMSQTYSVTLELASDIKSVENCLMLPNISKNKLNLDEFESQLGELLQSDLQAVKKYLNNITETSHDSEQITKAFGFRCFASLDFRAKSMEDKLKNLILVLERGCFFIDLIDKNEALSQEQCSDLFNYFKNTLLKRLNNIVLVVDQNENFKISLNKSQFLEKREEFFAKINMLEKKYLKKDEK